MKQYTLTVNEKQLSILKTAIDLYSRIGLGQFEKIHLALIWEDVQFQNEETVQQGIRLLKHGYFGFVENQSYGIHHPEVKDIFRTAYDMYYEIRHQTEMHNNVSVFRDVRDPLGTEPKIKISMEDV